MPKIYIFSGLGADKRAFQKVDFSTFEVAFIDWIEPNLNETIEDYALRLTQQIQTEKPILIGLSFGGIMATEVAKHIKTEKVILIAAAKTKFEVPQMYKTFGRLKIDQLLPANLLKQPNPILNWAFGVQNSLDAKLLADIVRDTDPKFLQWAIRKIVTWENVVVAENTVHIHGTNDRILPIRNIKNPIKVHNGGHFMTVDKAEELSALLKNEIENTTGAKHVISQLGPMLASPPTSNDSD